MDEEVIHAFNKLNFSFYDGAPNGRPIDPSDVKYAIRKKKFQLYTQCCDELKTFVKYAQDVRHTLLEAHKEASAALKQLQNQFEGLTQPSENALRSVFEHQEKKRSIKKCLSQCLAFRESFVPTMEEKQIILDPGVNSLSLVYLSSYLRLISKKKRLVQMVERVKESPNGAELFNAPVLIQAELSDLIDSGRERIFLSTLTVNQSESNRSGSKSPISLAYLSDKLLESLEAMRIVNKIMEEGKEINAEQNEGQIGYFIGIYVLRDDHSFSGQNLQAIASMRSRILSGALTRGDTSIFTQGIETVTFGSDDAKVPEMLTGGMSKPLDSTTFISSTLAAQLQLVKDEKRFAEGLFQYILPDVTHDASEESKSARVRKFLGNVFKDAYLNSLHLCLSEFLTLKPDSEIPGVKRYGRESITSYHKRLQSILNDPLAIFDKMYVLDFYIHVTELEILGQPLDGDNTNEKANDEVPLIAYMRFIREAFLSSLKTALDLRALTLKESPVFSANSTAIPEIVIESVAFIRSILKIFDQHIITVTKFQRLGKESDIQEDEKIVELNEIVNRVYHPLLNVCRYRAQDLNPETAVVMMLNIYDTLLISISTPAELKEWLVIQRLLQELIREALKDLVKRQFVAIAQSTGLQKILDLSENRNDGTLTSTEPPSNMDAVVNKISAFVKFTTHITTRFPRLTKIELVLNKAQRMKARSILFQEVAEAYERAYNSEVSVDDTDIRTPVEVRALLMIEGYS